MNKPIKKLFYTYTIAIDFDARKLTYELYHSKAYYYGIPYEESILYFYDKHCEDFEFNADSIGQFESESMPSRVYSLHSTKKLTKEELIEKFKEYTQKCIEEKTKQLQETCDMVVDMLNNLEEK